MHVIGVDVSKEKLDFCYLINQQSHKGKFGRFQNSKGGHKNFIQWIKKHLGDEPSMVHLIMEATGIYHQPFAQALFDQGFKVSVVNPARPKKFAEGLGHLHKTDRKDSFVLALFGSRMQPALWQPEPAEVRALKALLSRLEALDADDRRERNRLEKASFDASNPRVIESLNVMIEHIQAEKERLKKDIDDHINQYPQLKKDRRLLQSIPGVGEVVSRLMLSVLHSRQFSKAGQVAAFLGVVPKIQESGMWKGRSRLSKTGPAKIRAKLYMAAVICKQYNPDIRRQYERLLANGKSKMQALGAAMRKLVQMCFGVLKHQSQYQPQALI